MSRITVRVDFRHELVFGETPLVCLFQAGGTHLLHPFGRPGLVKDPLELVTILLRDAPHRSGTITVQIGSEPFKDIVQMLLLPFPYLSGLRVSRVVEATGVDAVAVVQHVGAQVLGQKELLTAFFRFNEITQFYGQITQSHDDEPRSVLPRASCHAAHTLTAIPDRVAFEQLLDFVLILALDDATILLGS